MIHTSITRNWVVFLLPRRQTRSAIYGCQVFDFHKWPTVLVRTDKGKPCNFEANLCGRLYSTLKHLSKMVTRAFYRPTRLIQGNVSFKCSDELLVMETFSLYVVIWIRNKKGLFPQSFCLTNQNCLYKEYFMKCWEIKGKNLTFCIVSTEGV